MPERPAPARQQGRAGLAASTVVHVRITLGKALDHAMRNGRIVRSPVRLTDTPKMRRPDVQPFTEGQAYRLLDAVEGDRLEALYVVALTLGLRKGELLGLRWQDVDLKRGKLHVRQQLQQMPGKKPEPKALKAKASRRDLDLGAQLARQLRAYQDRQRIEQHAAGEGWRDHDLVFPTSVGTPIIPRNLGRHYKATLRRAGLPDRGFHNLRHTAATMMFARSLSATKVQRILGHSSISVTNDTYIHWLPKDGREVVEITDCFLAARQERAG